MTEITLVDIEKQVEGSRTIRYAMNMAVNNLKDMEKKIGAEGPAIIKTMINGKRKLSVEEYAEAGKKFGPSGLMSIEAMEHLNRAQKQYLFKRMGYPIEDVE
jgi:antitoxin component HigA of HigAB toxin-antitoxin module